MTKQDYLKPDIDDLKKGSIVTIYNDVENQKDPVGKAILIKRKKGHGRDELSYIRAEIGGTEKQNPHTIVWNTQRWIIKYIDGPLKDFTTARYIAHFECIDSILKDTDDG